MKANSLAMYSHKYKRASGRFNGSRRIRLGARKEAIEEELEELERLGCAGRKGERGESEAGSSNY